MFMATVLIIQVVARADQAIIHIICVLEIRQAITGVTEHRLHLFTHMRHGTIHGREAEEAVVELVLVTATLAEIQHRKHITGEWMETGMAMTVFIAQAF